MTRISPIAVLLAAKAVSDIGFALDFVILGVFVWVSTGSALATSAVGLCLYAGGMLGGRLSQRYGASWNRRRAMVNADLARMLVLAVLAVLPDAGQMWWLFLTVFVIGAGRSVFEATLAAATPALGGPARTQSINSAVSGLKGIALVVGMGLATVAVPLVGYRGVFALDALTYALSAAVLLLVSLRLRDSDAAARSPGRRALGWAVLATGGLAALVVVRGMDAFGSGSHHVGLPLLGALYDADNPSRVVGALWMVWAAGTFAGSFALRPLLAGPIRHWPVAVFGLATAVMSAGFIAIFWVASWPAMLVAAAIAGLGDALSEITFKQALQQLPDESRGAAFGTAQIIVNVGFAAGLVCVGSVATQGRMAGLVLVLHGVAMVAAIGLTARSLTRSARSTATSSRAIRGATVTASTATRGETNPAGTPAVTAETE